MTTEIETKVNHFLFHPIHSSLMNSAINLQQKWNQYDPSSEDILQEPSSHGPSMDRRRENGRISTYWFPISATAKKVCFSLEIKWLAKFDSKNNFPISNNVHFLSHSCLSLSGSVSEPHNGNHKTRQLTTTSSRRYLQWRSARTDTFHPIPPTLGIWPPLLIGCG